MLQMRLIEKFVGSIKTFPLPGKVFLITIFYALFSLSFSLAQPEMPYDLVISVVGEDYSPLVGTKINVINDQGEKKTFTTDKKGKLRASVPLGVKHYKVYFEKTGYVKQHFLVEMSNIPDEVMKKMKAFGAGNGVDVVLTKNDGTIDEFKYNYPFAKFIWDGKRGIRPDEAYKVQFDAGTAPEIIAAKKKEEERIVREKEEQEQKEKALKEAEEEKKLEQEEKERKEAEAKEKEAEKNLKKVAEAEKKFEALAKKQAQEKAKAEEKRKKEVEKAERRRKAEEEKKQQTKKEASPEKVEQTPAVEQVVKEKKLSEEEQDAASLQTKEILLKREEEKKKIQLNENKTEKVEQESDLVKTAAENERIAKQKAIQQKIMQEEVKTKVQQVETVAAQKTIVQSQKQKELAIVKKATSNKVEKSKTEVALIKEAAIAQREAKRRAAMRKAETSPSTPPTGSKQLYQMQISNYKIQDPVKVDVKEEEDFFKITKTITITQGSKKTVFVKETYNVWGDKYYKNGAEIDEDTYQLNITKYSKGSQ